MYKQRSVSFLFLCLLLCFKSGLGQITATPSFTGCAPYSVLLSGPAGATNIYWTFGSAMGSATLSTPNPIFSTPGTYNITYTALVNNAPVNYTAQILVKAKPSASYVANIAQNHCAPVAVSFNGSGGSPGSIYVWAFGDLSALGSGASVTHTYLTANSFVPILTVIDAVSGCTATALNVTTVNVSSPPVLTLNSSNGFNACAPPFTSNFDANGSATGSPLGGALTYAWSFNAGNPSNAAGVSSGAITFGAGIHTITLTGTDNNQCSGTKTEYVSVVSPSLTANFPGTVCINAAIPGTITTNQSIATVSVLGIPGSTALPVFNGVFVEDTVFLSNIPPFIAGLNTLVVSVQPAGCPALTYTQAVFVESITASFSWVNPTVTCHNPLIANFVNQTTLNTSSILTYTWNADNAPINYNHGTPSSSIIVGSASPSFTFTQNHPNPYTIYQPFQPMITLIAESPFGCKSKFLLDGSILIRPTAFFKKDTMQGCVPLVVTFTDVSTSHTNFPITSYTWCSGTAPPTYTTGTISSPPPFGSGIPTISVTYSIPGTYHPYLIIATAGGCSDISFLDSIVVAAPPVLSATFPASVCAGQPFTMSLSSTPSSTLVDHWHVTTDTSFFSGCVTSSNPSFAMTHPGTHSVTVTGYTAGCKGETALAQTVLVKGPVGKFRMITDCSGNKREVNFNVRLQEAASATLNFGDGNSTTLSGNPSGSVSYTTGISHIYAISGNYTVTLTSSGNNGCAPYVFQQIAKIRSAKANILYNGNPIPALPAAMACVRDPYDFTGKYSTDHDLSCESHYTWFYEAPTYTLAPAHMNFISSPPHPRENFSSVIMPPPIYFMVVDPISRDTFRYAGTYTIGLRVKDINGCIDEQRIPFRISSAVPVFTFAQNPACLSAGEVTVINTTQNAQIPPDTITSYTWNFGDNTADTSGNNPYFIPKHKYYNTPPPSQTFAVMCIASNDAGCIDTTIHAIQINNPIPNFFPSTSFPCVPKGSAGLVSFSATSGYASYSVNYGGPASTWSNTNTYNGVIKSFSPPGIYIPTLTVTDNAGCKASESLTITALGQPTASIAFPDGRIGYCKGSNVILKSNSNIHVTPITNFSWHVGSIISSQNADTLGNTYFAPVTTVSLIVSMTSLSFCPSTTTVNVYIYDPLAYANVSPTLICLGEKLNVSIQIERDVAHWQWFFGDFVQQPIRYNTAFTPTLESYAYTTFPTSGVNGNAVVTLSYNATNDGKNGCPQSVEVPIRIIKVESDFKNLADIYAHCLKIGDTFTSTATNFPELNLNYDWNFGDQTTGSGPQAAYTHTYTNAGVYTVTLTTRDIDYGCKAISTKQMTLFPLPSATISARPNVCPNAQFLIEGQGTPGISGLLTGTMNPVMSDTLKFNAANTFTSIGTLTLSGNIYLTVTDENKCSNVSNNYYVNVQKAAPQIIWDTTVIIGQIVPLNAFVGAGYTYTWTPLTSYLNCDVCNIYNPVSSTTASIVYSVAVEDELNCSVVKNTYRINVEIKVSLDVPTAFTPNGDGINDIIYPNGWGLRKLNYFKIFNRWGQLIFESNDLNIGWDGVFQGVPQNMETYVYQVSAETFSDKQPTLSKTGTFKLLR
ncbi:hypothetical protein CNR22_20435 [Sphingobacteriaceae bacterium]|nr:hypothetical protein CNR22_20435 [Sphingobacteriaceae bacterium]